MTTTIPDFDALEAIERKISALHVSIRWLALQVVGFGEAMRMFEEVERLRQAELKPGERLVLFEQWHAELWQHAQAFCGSQKCNSLIVAAREKGILGPP